MHSPFVAELSGESQQLAKAELEASMRALGQGRIFDEDECVVSGEFDGSKAALAKRIALAHNVAMHVQSCESVGEIDISKIVPLGKSFRVRARRIMECHKEVDVPGLERAIGEELRGIVDLDKPEYEVRILLGKRVHVCELRQSWRVDRSAYEARKAQNRPFFSPITLHPKLARAVVNLTGVRKGERLLDPFCGTGGILIEAGLVGAHVLGADADAHMVEGTKKNLHHFGVKGTIFECDIGDLSGTLREKGIRKVKCIATDPPYGRAATTMGEPIEELYKRAFREFRKVLSGKMAIILPSDDAVTQCKRFFAIEYEIPVKVHGSLTRHFCVFTRKE